MGVGDGFGFYWEIYYSFVSHYFLKLGVGGVAYYGLGLLACHDGVLNFALGLSFVALADGLVHCHGFFGLHAGVWETTAHAVFFLVEGDLFAMGGSYNPIAPGVVTDSKTVCLKLWEEEKVCNDVAHKP